MQPDETAIRDLSQQIVAAVHPLRIISFGGLIYYAVARQGRTIYAASTA